MKSFYKLVAVLFLCGALCTACAAPQQPPQRQETAVPTHAPPTQYEWVETNRPQAGLKQYPLNELYKNEEKWDLFPFAFHGDTMAYFQLGEFDDSTQMQDILSVNLYSISQASTVKTIEVGARYDGCAIAEFSEGADLLIYDGTDPQRYALLWYRWSWADNTLRQIMTKPCDTPRNWTLLTIEDRPCLVTYNEEEKQLVAVSEENQASVLVQFAQEGLFDLYMDSRGDTLLLLEAKGESARFALYKNGKRVASRDLAENERIYSMHLLEEGVLLNMQILRPEMRDQYKLVWWPFEGEETELLGNGLFRAVSNHKDTVLFTDFTNFRAAVWNCFTVSGGTCRLTRINLDPDFSSLPQLMLLDSENGLCGVFAEESQKLLLIPTE